MASLSRGDSSNSANPVLDIYTTVGNPPIFQDVATLAFQIFDISTPAKKGSPVQVYPAAVGTFQSVDTVNAPPLGGRLAVGHYFAEWDVPLTEAIGDHKIVWQWQHTALSPQETAEEEFYVIGAAVPTQDQYTTIDAVRAEGCSEDDFSDLRIDTLIQCATKYIDKVTGRWFVPRTFDALNPLKLSGRDGKQLMLPIPIIRLDKLEIESQGFLNPDLTEIDLGLVRVYNRHLSGLTQPDDRENPRLAFIQTRIVETVASGLFPAPHKFPLGHQNIFLQGSFGYTDWDGGVTPEGVTPKLIQKVALRLVLRDLFLECSQACEAMNAKHRFRIVYDKEGSTTIRLQDLWLKGAYTGDPEIDTVLAMFRRPPSIGVV